MAETHLHTPHCPFCLSPVLPTEDSVVCSACGIPHHRECWRLNGRCTTYGCVGRPVPVPREPTTEALEDELGLELPPINLTREDVLAPSRPSPPRPPAPTVIHGGILEQALDGATDTPTNWRPILGALVFWVVLATLAVIGAWQPRTPEPPEPPSPPPVSKPLPPPPVRPRAPRSRPPNASLRFIKRRCLLRYSPDESAQPLAELSPGDTVELLEAGTMWARVRLGNGQMGYLLRSVMATVDSVRYLPAPQTRSGGRR